MNESDKHISKTILQQLCGGTENTGRLKVMIGAHSFSYSSEKKCVSFQFKSKAKNKANSVSITLDDNDTYTVEFLRISGFNLISKSVTEELYCSDLHNHFTEETGLSLVLS